MIFLRFLRGLLSLPRKYRRLERSYLKYNELSRAGCFFLAAILGAATLTAEYFTFDFFAELKILYFGITLAVFIALLFSTAPSLIMYCIISFKHAILAKTEETLAKREEAKLEEELNEKTDYDDATDYDDETDKKPKRKAKTKSKAKRAKSKKYERGLDFTMGTLFVLLTGAFVIVFIILLKQGLAKVI